MERVLAGHRRGGPSATASATSCTWRKCRRSTPFNAATYLKGTGGHWQVFIEAKRNSRDEPVTQYFQDLDKTIRAVQAPFWRGEMTVREWASQVKAKIDAVLQKDAA